MSLFGNQSGTGQVHRVMEIKGFRVACGDSIGLGDLDRKEWERPGLALGPKGIPYAEGMFAARGWGDSMEPRIPNGWWYLFHPNVVGTRQDRIVLVEDQSKIGGNRYTLKKYHSHTIYSPDGTWEHDEILLLPLNPGYAPIRLENDGQYEIRGWFVSAVPRIHRIEPFRYQDIDGE